MVSVMDQNLEPKVIKHIREGMRKDIYELSGIEGMDGLVLATLIRVLSNQYDLLGSAGSDSYDLSGPRLGILLRLYVEEKRGNRLQVTPTFLSHCQKVSKNTISSLLRGMENQGLIERSLDPSDRRVFRIGITEAGKDVLRKVAPDRIALMNNVVSVFSEDEIQLLIELLTRLWSSVEKQASLLRQA